jgi:glucose-1-phosphate adenylyltransferase
LGREASDWYRGTADAVYQNLYYLEESRADLVLILAGDHVYTMAYDRLVDFHRQHGADVSVPLCTVPWEEASRFGTLFLDDNDRITAFDEKPAKPRSNQISMGIYLFNKEALMQALVDDAERDDGEHDFGRDVLPRMVADAGANVYGYRFHGYWRDVGTIESYYQANMDLLKELPDLNLYDPDTSIRTRVFDYPPAKLGSGAEIHRSLLDIGCIVNGHVEHSILSPGVFIEEGAVVRDSIIFHDAHIQAGAVIDRSILDKQTNIGRECRIGYGDDQTPNRERPDIVNCGITILGKRATVVDGVSVGRNCVIGPGVVAKGVDGWHIPSGTTLRSQQRSGPFAI